MMMWIATKTGIGLILVNLFALLCTYGSGAPNSFVAGMQHALLALPALLLFDLGRYGLRCWRYDCLAD